MLNSIFKNTLCECLNFVFVWCGVVVIVIVIARLPSLLLLLLVLCAVVLINIIDGLSLCVSVCIAIYSFMQIYHSRVYM